ncbi:MAG TPA: S9 family peptidase [Vicinamibacterales bacterium]|nr:S9 family peptidase [Vicinamibacterales bacterium]
MQKRLWTLTLVVAASFLATAQQTRVPSIDELIALERPGGLALSPDGTRVAYTVTSTDWEENAYETEIYLARTDGGTPVQLTRARKSSMAPAWAPDGRLLAFVSDRTGKRQIYVISPEGGEARALTDLEEGVGGFEWSPDGSRVAFTMTDAKSDARKERDEKYGEFEIVDQDHRMTHLHLVDVAGAGSGPAQPRRLTDGAFTVGAFRWSPDGRAIAFDHRRDPNLANGDTADISVVSVDGGEIRPVVRRDGPDTNPRWSPDGSQIAFQSAMSNPWFFYMNGRIAIVPASGGASRSVTDGFDEQPSLLEWSPAGILFSGLERTSSRLYRVDPAGGRIAPLSSASGASVGGFSFSRDFSAVAYVHGDARAFPEVHVAPVATMAGRPLTSFGEQIRNWTVGTREMISWRSSDGTTIEGVLHKPADFQPGRRYPLLVVIHGGPTGISRPVRVQMGGVYPIELWLAKGAVVLEPNYRGSAGYGEKFRSLNVRNLGVGDAWDVLSGVDHLVAQGIADKDRLGAMGWSQGGYISAFLATHERQPFKAISVGAGISDWMTYYVNTDIHPFTRQYLKATPWEDPAIYARTSPITTITRAKTPTLIQHGELDARVPIPNAYELYQGLQDHGVPVKLIVYKGFGHGLNKPKAARAAMEQNLAWFDQYVFRGTPPKGTAAGHPEP